MVNGSWLQLVKLAGFAVPKCRRWFLQYLDILFEGWGTCRSCFWMSLSCKCFHFCRSSFWMSSLSVAVRRSCASDCLLCYAYVSISVEAVFECRHCLFRYGDILREGWQNLVECRLCKCYHLCRSCFWMSLLSVAVRRYPARGLAEPGGVSAMQNVSIWCRSCFWMSSLSVAVRRYPAGGLAEPGGVSAMQNVSIWCRSCFWMSSLSVAVRRYPAGGLAEPGGVPAADVPCPAAPHLHDGSGGLHRILRQVRCEEFFQYRMLKICNIYIPW